MAEKRLGTSEDESKLKHYLALYPALVLTIRW